MPNIATVLKDEITRLARKEIRAQIGAIKKASTTHRGEIAKLKRQITDLQRQLASLEKKATKAIPATPPDAEAESVRFTAKGLRSLRQRLGLSAADMGRLIGVSGQSIYAWEQERTRPRQQQTLALASIRGIGKKEAWARLEESE